MAKWLRQIVFGDVDAMFASAAAVADPSLASKPVAVGGPPPRGIIAAASYAVRAYGVHSAMPMGRAPTPSFKKEAPDIACKGSWNNPKRRLLNPKIFKKLFIFESSFYLLNAIIKAACSDFLNYL